MASAKQPLGVTLIVPPGQSATPVYLDPDGIETFATDDPYLLDDGRSLMPPLPVVDVGNVPGAIGVTDTGPTPINWDWQPFTLTAGDGDQWIGFSDGGATRPQPAFGAIDGQPTAITNLLALYDDTASNVYLAVFAGEWLPELSDLTLDIGGTQLTPFDAEVISGNTWLRYNGVGDWVADANYQIGFA